MVREFKLPDVGEGVAEGELVTWLVEEGDTVSEDQPVAEVETDKALVEVPAPVDGTVREILWEEGDVVPVGDVFITFDVEGEPIEEETEAERERREAAGADGDATDDDETGAATTDAETAADVAGEPGVTGAEAEVATPEGRVFAPPHVRRMARERGVDISNVEGSGPSGRITAADVASAAAGTDESTPGSPAEPTADAEVNDAGVTDEVSDPASAGETVPPAPSTVESADRDRTLAVPATRRIAREEGVDIDAVPAVEERDGEAFVTTEAVMEYAEAQRAAQAADAEAPAGADVTAAVEAGGVERVEYRGVRKTIGDAMERSKYTAPHVTHHETAVVENLVETRERLKPMAEERGIRLTYMPFVLKATVAALKQHPELNAELDEDAGEILRKYYYNLGIATATEAGLMVPVVDDVDGKGMLQLSSEVNELVERTRSRDVSLEELQGSTFTITNFGAIGGEYATPILNYPEVGILGIGELKQRPVVEDGEVVARHTLPISISIDHRIVDGADVAQFAGTFIEYVENPELLLLE